VKREADGEKIVDFDIPPSPPGHQWLIYPVGMVAEADSSDGYGRVIRVCEMCFACKVTVCGNNKAWREWRNKDGNILESMPQCEGDGTQTERDAGASSA
jgi:hypothetical protein